MIKNINKINYKKIIYGDICLIGSGPASLSILENLKKTNLKIILIPGGKFNFDKKNQYLYKGVVNNGSYHEQLIKNRFREFGGSGNYWGGRCVPLDHLDFKKRSWIKNSGWPINYSEIIKYYKLAAKFLQITPYDVKTNFKFNFIRRIINKMDDDFLSSTKLESWSPLLNFKKYFFKSQNRENIILIENSHLFKINANKSEVVDLECRTLNTYFKVKCNQYVLACGGIENPRILLNSKNKFHPKGLGNANDLVGRFYMAHHSGTFLNFFPFNRKSFFYKYFQDYKGTYLRNRWWLNEKFQKKKWIGNSVFFITNTNNSDDMGKSGKLFKLIQVFKSISQNNYNIFFILKIKSIYKIIFYILILFPKLLKIFYLRMASNRLPSVLPEISSDYFGIYHQVEQTPCYNSQLKLDKKKDGFNQQLIKLKLKFNPIDFRTILESHNYLINKINKFNIGKLQKKYNKKILKKKLIKKIKEFNSNAHHLGTTRMGATKKNGVVDKNLRIFGIKNIYITGSSVFPTGGHANPSFTIIALSIRLAKHLKKIIKKK